MAAAFILVLTANLQLVIFIEFSSSDFNCIWGKISSYHVSQPMNAKAFSLLKIQFKYIQNLVKLLSMKERNYS